MNFYAPILEVFKILQSYDYVVMLYGEDGNRVEDPVKARRMFARPENIMVSFMDDGDNSCIRLYVGKNTKISNILGLLSALRTAASKYNLLFNVRQYGRTIDPKDFAGETMKENIKRDLSKMEVFEGLYGTSRTSYLKLENARMIVRHNGKIDETKSGARSRCVESILIENSDGERVLFPTTSLIPARAMTQHVNLGGDFTDTIGQQIMCMAQDFANLHACTSYISTNPVLMVCESAQNVRMECRNKMNEMKKTFERMYRSSNGYMVEAKKIEDDARQLNETENLGDDDNTQMIEEMRKTLQLENSAFLSDSVLESVCKYCKSKISEAKEVPMVSVLGRKVSAEAWEKLKQDRIELLGKPKLSDFKGDTANPDFNNKTGELLMKLGAIVPVVKDDSLMNLLSFIVDRLPEEKDSSVAKKMRTLALFVVKAAGMSMNEGISESNRHIRSFDKWLSSFTATNSSLKNLKETTNLKEVYELYDDDETDEAETSADESFTVEDFIESDSYKDLVGGIELDDDDSEGVSIDEVQSALEDYFWNWIKIHFDIEASNEKIKYLADTHMDEVVAKIVLDGYKVNGQQSSHDELPDFEDVEEENFDNDLDDNGLDDDFIDESEFDDLDDDFEHRQILDDDDDYDMMEDAEMSTGQLTREDVLLPNPNKGKSLSREVTPRTVTDPETGEETEPNSNYINRLHTLSGLNQTNRQY